MRVSSQCAPSTQRRLGAATGTHRNAPKLALPGGASFARPPFHPSAACSAPHNSATFILRRAFPRAARPFIGIQNRFYPGGTAKIPRRDWAGGQFWISRGWLHRDLQQLQYLFLLGCWEAILIELSAADHDAVARDLRQTINHPAKCPASVFALTLIGQ